jgi:hypothetical protein
MSVDAKPKKQFGAAFKKADDGKARIARQSETSTKVATEGRLDRGRAGGDRPRRAGRAGAEQRKPTKKSREVSIG